MNHPKASASTLKTATNISTSVRAFCRAWVLQTKALEVGLDGRVGKRPVRRSMLHKLSNNPSFKSWEWELVL